MENMTTEVKETIILDTNLKDLPPGCYNDPLEFIEAMHIRLNMRLFNIQDVTCVSSTENNKRYSFTFKITADESKPDCFSPKE